VFVAYLHCNSNFNISLLNKSYACLQMLNCCVSSSQNAERESAYDIVKEKIPVIFLLDWTMFGSVANELLLLQIAALMKIPFLDEEMPSLNQPLPPKVLCIVTTCLYLMPCYSCFSFYATTTATTNTHTHTNHDRIKKGYPFAPKTLRIGSKTPWT